MQQEETSLLVTSTAFRSNMEKSYIDGISSLLNVIMPPEKEKYTNLSPKLTGLNLQNARYYYCSKCKVILDSDKSDTTTCKLCHQVYVKKHLMKREKYFYSFSLREQLEELLNSKLYLQLQKQCNESDVMSGTMYHEMAKKMAKNDLSLQWNVSEVKLSVTSPLSSTWLLQVMMNELPYRQRINNVFLCGIWHGDTKPRMNAFLRPFISELIDLRVNGLNCTTYSSAQPITIKFHTLLCTVDSAIRASILNINPPGKPYSCAYCYERNLANSQNPYNVRFPLKEENARTVDSHEKFCKIIVSSDKIVRGVRGPTVVMLHLGLDIPTSFPPDYVDSCLLGVCRQLITTWFDPVNKKEAFYLGFKQRLFNARLESVQRPCEVTRTPPKDFSTYTPSDWRNFVLYYSRHCLLGLLPEKYFQHWMALVKALHMFSQVHIDEGIFNNARTDLEEFLELAYQYYPSGCRTHELHQLRHLPLFVQRYGALWAWSSFPYRRYDDAVQLVFQRSARESGRDYSSKRLVETFARLRFIFNNSHVLLIPDCPMTGLFVDIMNDCRIKGCFDYGNCFKVLGKSEMSKLLLTERRQLRKMVGEVLPNQCEVYEKFVVRNALFRSKESSPKNMDDSVVMDEFGRIMRICKIVKVDYANGSSPKYIIKGMEMVEIPMSDNLYKREETQNIIYIDSADLRHKCFVIKDNSEDNEVSNPHETY